MTSLAKPISKNLRKTLTVTSDITIAKSLSSSAPAGERVFLANWEVLLHESHSTQMHDIKFLKESILCQTNINTGIYTAIL